MFEMCTLTLNSQAFFTVFVNQVFLLLNCLLLCIEMVTKIQKHIKMNANSFRKNIHSFTVKFMVFFFFSEGRLSMC